VVGGGAGCAGNLSGGGLDGCLGEAAASVALDSGSSEAECSTAGDSGPAAVGVVISALVLQPATVQVRAMAASRAAKRGREGGKDFTTGLLRYKK
jgi:hypothetical protein